MDVTLWVGVPVQAGDVWDIVAEGTSGTCAVGPSRLTCPTEGLVTFRWGPSSADPANDRLIVGQFALAPGEHGLAWALTQQERADLERWRTDALGAEDPIARKDAVYALRPWTWQANGPLPATSPPPIPAGFLAAMSQDKVWTVRRALVELCRDLRDPDGALEEELFDTLTTLAGDADKRVAKAAEKAIAAAAISDRVPAEQAWERAFNAVSDPGASGRSAALTLAKLGSALPPGGDIDPEAAVARTLAAHPEQAWRVWAGWKDSVQYQDAWVQTLLTSTISLNQGLVKHWAKFDADHLAQAIRSWEPAAPHSERFRVLGLWLADTPNDELRSALELP